jgi:hypothetical protein
MGDAETLPVDNGLARSLIDPHVKGVALGYAGLTTYHLPSLGKRKDLHGEGKGIDHKDQYKRGALS